MTKKSREIKLVHVKQKSEKKEHVDSFTDVGTNSNNLGSFRTRKTYNLPHSAYT